ncbi:LOG family protein [Spirosoma koreense]
MQSVVVYCASSQGVDPIYKQVATELGQKLAIRGIRLIYGGGGFGLMGNVADAVLQNGGAVIGVIPSFLSDLEVAHTSLTELHFVETMHERKLKMVQLAKGVIALPGGFGTLDELFEILTWRQLGLYDGPVAIINTNGYYDLMLLQLDRMVAEGFLRANNRNLLLTATSVDEALNMINNYWITV